MKVKLIAAVMLIIFSITASPTLMADETRYQSKVLYSVKRHPQTVLKAKLPNAFELVFRSNDPTYAFEAYMLQGEGMDNWSEMITLAIVPEKQGLDDCITCLVKQISKTIPNFDKTASVKTVSAGDDTKMILIDYPSTTVKGKREIIGIKAVKIDNRIWHLHYTIRYSPKHDHKPGQHCEAAAKISKFLKTTYKAKTSSKPLRTYATLV